MSRVLQHVALRNSVRTHGQRRAVRRFKAAGIIKKMRRMSRKWGTTGKVGVGTKTKISAILRGVRRDSHGRFA